MRWAARASCKWRDHARCVASRSKTGVAASAVALAHTLHDALHYHCAVPKHATLLVSVSAGADSVALLRMLLSLQNQRRDPHYPLDLHILHFNHNLRAESDDEEAFVRRLADEHALPLHVRRLPRGWADDASMRTGVQSRTRAWRRSQGLALLEQLDCAAAAEGLRQGSVEENDLRAAAPRVGVEWASASSGAAIALAHHADDQVETILLKLLRGCHLSNVRGMAWRQSRFVRPLLGVKKSELLGLLDDLGQPWMEDTSNAEPKYKRNLVRLELIPLLEQLAGGALGPRLTAMEQQSARLREWLDTSRDSFLDEEPGWGEDPPSIGVERTARLPAMLLDEVLHALVAKGSGGRASLSADAMQRLREQLARSGPHPWRFEVRGGFVFECRRGRVRVVRNEAVETD